MKVSILICTYNRAQFLDKLLRSLVMQEFEGAHEIIVVDNNSTDETRAVAESWMPRAHPRCPIRYVFAAQQGLSFARNVGAKAATGDVIAFIDDDAVAECGWLQCVLDDMADPSLACISGKVLPAWSEPPPDWVTPELLPAVGGSIHGNARCIMTGKLYPMGGNMAVRKAHYQAINGFNTSFGRVGTNLASVAEVEFADRLRRAGGLMLYDPEMIIHHHVPKNRMTKDYFARRRYWDGRSIAAWERTRGGWQREWAVGAARMLFTIPRDLFGLLIHSTLGPRSRMFTYFCRLKLVHGYLDEMRHGLATRLGRRSRAMGES